MTQRMNDVLRLVREIQRLIQQNGLDADGVPISVENSGVASGHSIM